MAIELRQQLKLSQQLVMTPQLQLAIKLLQLSRLELIETIRQELEENPALEEAQETLDTEASEKKAESEKETEETVKEVSIDENIPDEIDWRNYLDEYNSAGRASFEIERRETPGFESFLSKKDSLQDHLLWQLLMTSPDEEQEAIGSMIIGNINADGYLDVSVDDIANATKTTPEAVESMLKTMQGFDPIGICASDLRECLLIQTEHYGLQDGIVSDIINKHLNHLENRNLKALCKCLDCNRTEIIAAVEVIKGLEPKPGRVFSDDTPYHITPDIFVYKLEDEFVIMLNDSGLPRLRVNAFYRNNLLQNRQVTDQEKDYIREKMRSATWLIRSIHQRQKTIYRVMESILRFQREFFEKGISYLKPMVLRDVAEDINMHESTISRVTTNKYAHTPQGIFELKYFFNSPINRIHGEAIASASVKQRIKTIIDNEDTRKPYSDKKITEILKSQNINIARRTVAKYREMLNVLPSSKRKQFS